MGSCGRRPQRWPHPAGPAASVRSRLSWQFPAGKVDLGEAADAAAVREVLEETGVAVRAARVLGRRVHPDTDRTMVYVACEFVGGTAQVAAPEEIADVAWCERAAVTTYEHFSSGFVQVGAGRGSR
ncbi:NUDIX hydrolase [Actinoplanes sp. NPDC049265]|uniref:NUDIX hydrolase n=1 Tax=Actinoplanes sp. NPDC049265 TaxID=3363902 RepID=UPI00371821DF